MPTEPVPAAVAAASMPPPSVHGHSPIFAQSVQILCVSNFIINIHCISSNSNSNNNIIQVKYLCEHRWCRPANSLADARYPCVTNWVENILNLLGKICHISFIVELTSVPQKMIRKNCFTDYLDSPSTSMSSPVNLSAAATNLSTYGGCNSPYKNQRQQTNVRERKRMMRSAPNGWVGSVWLNALSILNEIVRMGQNHN